MKDFFISYNGANKQWAEWIAWQLEEAGYEVVIQAWDSKYGQDFVDWMDKASKDSERIIGILSIAYLADEARFSRMERNVALYSDKLLPVRIEAVEVEGLLGPIAYIDLVDLNEAEAREKLLQDVKLERKKPRTAPVYPGSIKHTVAKPKRFPGTVPSFWNLPYLRNPNFTGRDDTLNELHQALNSGQPTALTQAITGLGGIGKTQIALEYAYRYAADYEIIWWIRSEESETLAADYANFAKAQKLPEKELAEQELIIIAVRRWLEQHNGWLLIFDNVVDPEDLREYIPRGPSKRVLITSRHQDWSNLAHSIAVQTWPREEAVDFLLKRTGQSDRKAVDDLAKVLGDLPLALEQAASYMKPSGISFRKYLTLFTARRKDLWKAERPPVAYHQDTVATTWSLAIAEVNKAAPIGTEILNLCAFLAPDKIPRSLLDQVAEHLPEKLAEMFRDPLTVNEGIQGLNHYSLSNVDYESLSVHRLIQAVVRDNLSENNQKKWASAVLRVMDSIFPSDSYSNIESWPQCMKLFSHSHKAVENVEKYEIPLDETCHRLLSNMALYMRGRAAYAEAESLYAWQLKLYLPIGDQNPLLIALILADFAAALKAQGKYNEAEKLYRRSIEIYSSKLGKDHLHLADPLNDLAFILNTKRKHHEAERLCRRALMIQEMYLEKPDPQIAKTLHYLGATLMAQNKYIEAEQLLRRALKIEESQSGKKHRDVALVLLKLGELFQEQEKYKEAKSMYLRALEINKSLGKDHPDYAASLRYIASLFRAQGKYNEAEKLYRRSLEIYEQLGSHHPYVANVLNILASLLKDQKKYTQAEPLFHRAVKICETVFGEDHPNTTDVRKNFDELLLEMKSSREK